MNRCITLPVPCREKTVPAPAVSAEFSYHVFNSIADVSQLLWDNFLPHDHLLLNRNYLQGMESSTGSEVQYKYLVIQKNREVQAIGFFQIITFKGSNVEQEEVLQKNSFSLFISRLWRKIVVAAINKISMKLLVSGNSFVTGEYGFHFSESFKKNPNALNAVAGGIEQIISESNVKISGVLVKDFYEKDLMEGLTSIDFLEFKVNPNMILEMDASWKNFDDYLAAMTSKYRTRMRKAISRASDVTMREMTAEELENSLPQLSGLFNEVVDEAAFKLAKPDIQYIAKLKKNLGENFGVIGFFKNEKPGTFISYYVHQNEMIAGYMGMQRSLNLQHDLYLNVLLQLAKTAIDRKLTKVVYGRTAMEIKSSVGALPHLMYLYVKHRSALVNFIVKRIVRFLSKEPEWNLRSPFKAEAKAES